MISYHYYRTRKALFLLSFLLLHGLTSHAQGVDPKLSASLQNTLDSFRTASGVKGISACVWVPAQGAWKGVSGVSYAGVPVTPDMVFGIGSNTKLFTGVMLLKLLDDHLLSLDDSLKKWLPTYPNVNPNITIRQLLHHTSGLADVNDVTGYPDSILLNPNRVFSHTEVMNWVGPPLFAPGTGWSYSNTNYLLAALICEKVTGKKLSTLLRDSILTPLQLDTTFMGVEENAVGVIAHPWQGGVDKNNIPRTSLNSAAWAAGAMYSTSGEMVQWYKELMSGHVLLPNSFREMTTFVGSGKYGVGISETAISGRTIWQHGGSIWGGYNSSMIYDTATGIIVCVLINDNPAQAFVAGRQLLLALGKLGTGLRNVSLQPLGITCVPNPSCSGIFTLQTHDADMMYHIKVFSAEGQLLLTQQSALIDLSMYPPGCYYARVESGSGSGTVMLLKR